MNRILGISAVALAMGCASDNTINELNGSDVWAQAENNEVDILWVVDDSCSMSEEQDTLANGFSTFVSQMEASGTEFHIGAITTSFEYTDPDRGKLLGEPPFLTNDDDYETLFPELARVGIGGSDKEKGLEAAAYALSPTMTSGPNAGFLRPDAQLLVVVVSDEEDCSDEGALEGEPAAECYLRPEQLVPVSELVSDLRDVKREDDMVQLGAIVGVRDAACQDTYPGARYMQTAALTGGLIGDICQSNWSNMLTDLGLNATGIRVSFQLSDAAQPDTLEVTVDEVDVPEDPENGWSYDPETWFITFHNDAIPPRGSEVAARYAIQSGVPVPPAEAQ